MTRLICKTSAPGKVILNGEHSVVYGKTAIAGSLGIRTRATIEENEMKEKKICVKLKDISMNDVQISFDNLIEYLSKNTTSLIFDLSKPEHLDHEKFLHIIRSYWETQKDIHDLNEVQSRALIIVIYILSVFIKCIDYKFAPFTLNVSSEITIGSGIGSSASFAVSTTAVLYLYFSMKRGTMSNSKKFSESDKHIINNWAYYCEKISHGNPSGIDNTVCTFGSIVEFRKNEPIRNHALKANLRIALVNTNVTRNTKDLVSKVKILKTKHPKILESILETLDHLALKALLILNNIKGENEDDKSKYEDLSELFNLNHNLLRALNVSHPSLETICNISKELNFGCKLTGAGGGGCAIILIPPYSDNILIEELTNKLQNNGFQIQITELGGDGVLIEE